MSLDPDCFEKIGLFFSAQGLPKMDVTSQTDAFVVVYCTKKSPVANGTDSAPKLLGNTTVVKDSANPKWPDQLVIDYFFEAIQLITVKVYDQDAKALPTDLSRHELIGEASFLVTDLMCNRAHKLDLKLKGPKNMGSIEIRGEAVTNTRDVFIGTFAGAKLSNKDGFFGKSDPFLQISRMYEDGKYGVVWKNEPVINNLSPTWPLSRIPMTKLCNGDIDRPLRVEIFDFDSSGKHASMGIVDTSVRSLLDSHGSPQNIIEEDKKKKSSSYVNSGTLSVSGCAIEQHPTFTDYVMGGCEISLMVAIDFTGSNGDPSSHDSLHFINRSNASQLNQYQTAIGAIGSVIEKYDTDQMFPVYGFGGKVRLPDGHFSQTEHCFPVYGANAEVHGVSGILQAYSDSLSNVQLSGPTLFGPLLQQAVAISQSYNCSQEMQKYAVLLILTDGAINDMSDTIQTIIDGAEGPLSVVIIGVGNADFRDMNVLDGDGKVLSAGGRTCSRDIVQFVPFLEVARKGPGAIAEEVLAEIPNQVLSYMAKRGITPKRK